MSVVRRPKCPECQLEANIVTTRAGKKLYQCPDGCLDPKPNKNGKNFPFWLGFAPESKPVKKKKRQESEENDDKDEEEEEYNIPEPVKKRKVAVPPSFDFSEDHLDGGPKPGIEIVCELRDIHMTIQKIYAGLLPMFKKIIKDEAYSKPPLSTSSYKSFQDLETQPPQ